MHFSSIFYLTVLLGSHTYLILLTDRNHRTIWRTAVFLRYIPWRNIAGVPPNTAASVNTQPIHVSHSYSWSFVGVTTESLSHDIPRIQIYCYGRLPVVHAIMMRSNSREREMARSMSYNEWLLEASCQAFLSCSWLRWDLDVVVVYYAARGSPTLHRLITGPPTHIDGLWRLSSVFFVCRRLLHLHMQRKSPGGSTRRRASSVTSRYGDNLLYKAYIFCNYETCSLLCVYV